jgi:hypothetical protein
MTELDTHSTVESTDQQTEQHMVHQKDQQTDQANSSDIQKNMSELYKNGIDIASNLLNDLKTLNIQNIIGKLKKVLNAYENLDTEKKFTYAVGSFLLMMVFGILTDILFSVSYIAYPIYATMKAIKAIKAKSEDNMRILTKWSIYWIVYSLFNFVESYFPLYNHIPYYKYIKLFVLVFGFMDLTVTYNKYSLNLTDHAIKLYEKYNELFDGIASKFGIEYNVELKESEDKKTN